MSKCSVIGIDLAKNSFHVHGCSVTGRKIFSKKLSRSKLIDFMVNQHPTKVAMEACGSSHFWARFFRKFGHDTVLISPQFVKPYVKANKTDSADAEAICEAASRENMRFVPIKNLESQDLTSLGKIRERYVKNATALSNQIRGLLSEYGVFTPQGKSSLRQLLADHELLQKQGELTPVILAGNHS